MQEIDISKVSDMETKPYTYKLPPEVMNLVKKDAQLLGRKLQFHIAVSLAASHNRQTND